jgi:hypothetical protein
MGATLKQGQTNMKNVHIELVKKWLADPTTVSPEELKVNADAAKAVYAADASSAAFASPAAYVAYAATSAAASTSVNAVGVVYAAVTATAAAHWVKRYEGLTK